MKKTSKTIGTILCILILLITGYMLFWYFYNKGKGEVFVLPDNYTGAVIILFDESNGIFEKIDEDGNRIYEIPSSGILKTKFKFQEGFRGVSYKTIDGKKLRYLWPADKVWNDTIKNKSNDSIYVYGASYAKDYWFIVGKINDIDSLQNVMMKKWESYSEKTVLKEGDNIDNRK
jgi:hypothetical protein